MPAPNFGGGVPAPNFRGGVPAPNFRGGVGGLQFSEYGQRSAGTHPTGMHSCFYCLHGVARLRKVNKVPPPTLSSDSTPPGCDRVTRSVKGIASYLGSYDCYYFVVYKFVDIKQVTRYKEPWYTKSKSINRLFSLTKCKPPFSIPQR